MSRGSPSGVHCRPGAADVLQRVRGRVGAVDGLRTKGREAGEGAEWKAGVGSGVQTVW